MTNTTAPSPLDQTLNEDTEQTLRATAQRIVQEMFAPDFEDEGEIDEDLTTFLSRDYGEDLFLWDGYLVKGGLGVIGGAEKSLKSITLGHIAICASLGVNFLGRRLRRSNTWLIEGEGAPLGWKKRLFAMLRHHGVTDPNTLPLRFSLRRSFDLNDQRSMERVVCNILIHNIELLIIGPLSHTANIENENDAAEFKAIGRRLNRLCETTGITILLAHHTRKPTRKPQDAREFFTGLRGSNALMGFVDSALGILYDNEAMDGYLFSLQREAGSAKPAYFRFNPEGLVPQLTNDPGSQGRRATEVENVLFAHPRITKAELAGFLNRSEKTAAEWARNGIEKGDIVTYTAPGRGRATLYDLSEPRYHAICEEKGIEYHPRDQWGDLDTTAQETVE